MPTPADGSDARHRPVTEAAVVLGLPVAVFVIGGVLVALMATPETSGDRVLVDFGGYRLVRTLAVEVALGIALLPWLARRGWTPRVVAGAPTPIDFLRGIGLFLALGLCMTLFLLLLGIVMPEAVTAARRFTPTGSVPAAIVIAVTLINPVFEEFLWLGYGVNALERFGVGRAGAISVLLRTTVHLYQGAQAVVGILPLGLVITVYYVRTRRIWPVVVAHAIMDAASLARLV